MLSNLDAVFLPAVFRMAATSKDPEKLFLKKLTACWTARGVCERYLQEGVLEDLVRVILEKKLALIARARACLKNINMPNRRVFCPLDGAIFP